jgi:hypothetical protein
LAAGRSSCRRWRLAIRELRLAPAGLLPPRLDSLDQRRLH